MMNKLHLLIASAMVTIGMLVTPAAAYFESKCKDKKGLVHVGDDVTMTCADFEGKPKEFYEKACNVKKPSPDGAPPAAKKCRESCGRCPGFVCESFYSTYVAYVTSNIYTYPKGCPVTIQDGEVCIGTSVSVVPIPLYRDKETTKEAGVTLISAGNFVTNTTSLSHGAFSFKDEKFGGSLFFSTITDIYSPTAEATSTGGTGVFRGANGWGKLELFYPSLNMTAGLAEYEICLD